MVIKFILIFTVSVCLMMCNLWILYNHLLQTIAYLLVYDKCPYKFVNNQMADYLDNNPFETEKEISFWKISSSKCYKRIDLNERIECC